MIGSDKLSVHEYFEKADFAGTLVKSKIAAIIIVDQSQRSMNKGR